MGMNFLVFRNTDLLLPSPNESTGTYTFFVMIVSLGKLGDTLKSPNIPHRLVTVYGLIIIQCEK